MTMELSLCHCVHSCSHVSQILVFIYADGAVLTAAANDMLATSQNAVELQCWGGATLGGMRNLSATNGSSVFRHGPLLAEAHTSAHPASRMMRHSPSSIRLLRWTLIIRICGTPSAQPFLHVCPASRGPWHWARLHRARSTCLASLLYGPLLHGIAA